MQHIYWFIIFDVASPANIENGKYKRISKNEYKLLLDMNIDSIDVNEVKFKIVSRRSFMIHTSIDCSLYIVIDAEKCQ